MPKQLNVSLAFTADTAQAKRQIQELQQSLEKLSSDTIKNNIGNKMTEDLQKSIVAASQLKNMLQQAVNPNTGNLDLSRFSEQLKASGRDIQSYARDLNNLGPEGTKTFMQLAQSIASAEVPMRRTNALMKEFGVTLMNAARWQFSSSVLHGLMGAIQGAYGYAQDLNKSLTDIAIVTGRSTDQMAEFAEQANKSAQALSVSTTAYTDAALIYYQQGLDDVAVKARTDITMMMSNVTGESAEHVSSYMTAIWNNFAEGSDNLEHFADVITALGAATASSSEEIANGMQQFAAVADTVGLSYEYAATALATVVAQTRQSESTVGNSFRTIFSRLQGLKLGDTLEDGTDLNKYSEALAKVGVNIKDQNGDLKDMNTILDEIGAKWETLAKDQQIALAQTVGGVRQYTNLVALFDNWDKFQENLSIAEDSEGTLQQQADIYAQSWEAAQKRVKAAWQAIYQDLIDDKFFITILDGFEKVLKGVDNLIDGLGGLKGVLGVVGALITTVFAEGLAKGIQNAVYNFKVFTGQAQQDADALAVQFKNVADQMGQDLQSPTATAEVGVLKDQIDFALKLRQASDSITEANKQQLLSLNEITKQYGEAYVEAVKLKEAAEEAKGNATYKAREVIGDNVDVGQRKAARDIVGSALNTENLNEQIDNFRSQQNGLSKAFDSIGESLKNGENSFDQYGKVLAALNETSADVIEHQTGLADAIDQVSDKLKSNVSEEKKKAALESLIETFNKTKDSSNALTEFLQDSVVQSAKQIASDFGLSKEATDQLVAAFKEAANAAVELNINTEQADNAQANYTERLKQAEIEFENLKGKIDDYSTKIVTCARGMSQLWASFNAFGKILDTLNNKDLTWAEKLKSIIPSLLTGLPMLINSLRTLSGVSGSFLTVLGNGAKVIMANGLSLTSLGSALGVVKVGFVGLIGPMLPVIGTIAVLTAGVWILVEAFKAWKASTPEGKLEAANNALEESKKKVEETSKAYQEAKAGLEEYAEAVEHISQMESGSERSEAIVEENNKVLELLDSLDAWSKIGEIKYDSTGLIQLTDTQKNILENDYKREASLARQAEYQSKINQLTAQADVNYKNEYDGKKIRLTRQTGTTTVEGGGQTHEVGVYESQDVTREIASILNEAGLTASSNDSLIENALKNAGFTSEEITNTLLPAINEIAANTAKLQEFNDLQSDVASINAQTDAIRTQEIRDTLSRSNEFNNLTEESQKIAIERLKEKWDSVKNSISEAIDNQEDLTEAFKNAGLEVDNLNLKWQTVHQAIASIDEDIDEDELASLSSFLGSTKIEGLSDQLLEIDEAAQGVAESILRFDDAIQDVTDNYEDWTRSLKTGTLQDQAKTMSELEDAYSDLLDLNFGSLDSNFLGDVENLELLKKACEGSEEAYNQLQERARENILGQVGLDTTDFDNKFLELDNKIQTGLNDIEVGAFVDDTQALQAMNELINAADMTAEQATDLLASMGVDAEVEQVTVPENQKQALIDAEPNISYEPISVPEIAQDGLNGTTVDTTTVQVPKIDYEPIKAEEVQEGEKTATMLRVTSARKSSGGGFKFQHSSRGGGATPKSSKGSGGKGGGSSKKPEVKEHKEHVKKEDRYHDIKEQLEDVRLEYDKVNKAKDRAFGKSKLKYLDQEIKKLKEEESLLKKYREEAEAYAKVDRAALEGTGMGAKFNDNGALTNYEEVLANINKSYNNAIDTYNNVVDVYNASAQEEADKEILDRANKELDAQKKVYDDRLEKLKQYEDTYNLWQEQVWNELQKHWEEFDAEVEKVTTKIEIELDFNENDRKFLEWLYDNLGDEADYATDRIANLSKQMGEIESDIDIYKTGLKDIFALHNIDLDFDNLNADELVTKLQDFMKDNKLQSELTEEEAESIRNSINGLMESYNELKEKADEVHENVLNAFDQFNERLERQMDIFDRLNKKLTNYQNIIDLTGRKTLKMTSNEVRKLNQAIIDNAQNELASAKKIADELAAERDRAKKEMERFQAIGDEQSFKYWENIFNEFDDKAADAMDNYYSAFEKTLELTEDAFKRSMELMKEDYNDALGDLNLISEQFSRQKELDELYLPDYKKYHELNKSTKELNKSLANTNNTLIKGKMNDLMDEINQKMENGVQISGYETEIIARRVALLQAEAELQNAKNAKSAVRMTRDNEGNFSYTYTADQNKISGAEENVSDKFYELLDYERNTQNEIQEQMIQKQQQFIDDIAEINERYKDDEETRVAALKELMTSYHQWMDFYASQDQILMFEMGRLRDEDWQDIERITGLKLADNENFISTWEDTIYGRLMPGYETAEDALDAWKDAAKITLDQANTDANNWEKEVEETFKEAGTDVETFKKKVDTELGQVQTESDKTRKAVEAMVDDPEKGMKVKMKEAMDAAGEFDTKYGTVMSHIQTEIGNTVDVLNEMLQKLGETYQEQVKLGQQAEATAASMNAAAQAAQNLAAAQSAVGSGGGGGSTYVPNNSGGDPPPSTPKDTLKEVYYSFNSAGTDGHYGTLGEAESKGSLYGKSGIYRINVYTVSGKKAEFVKSLWQSSPTTYKAALGHGYLAYDTGGYTGDWGTTNGKLAILHQKEVVLNEDDTKNLLQSVDIVRGIANMLKTQQVPQTNINYSGVFAAAGAGALQQQVHIDASFPNVQSHSEIELALNNLINSASQYVNRK